MSETMTDAPEAPRAPSQARLRLRVLGDEDMRRVHEAALALLGDAAGAAEAAASASPAAIRLAGREPQEDILLDGAGCLLGTGGPAPRVRPLGGGEPLPATTADLAGLLRLADALPEVAVVGGPPVTVAGESALGELALCLGATVKHVQLSTLHAAAEAEAAVQMALLVAGGDARLRTRPVLSLCGGADVTDAAVVFARAGLPVSFVAAPRDATAVGEQSGAASAARPRVSPLSAAVPGSGASAADAAPDLAVALARHHAAVLAACAAVQAVAPGAAFVYPAQPTLAGLPACGPQAVLFQVACVQLARLVGLPVSASGIGTGSHEPDWQACTQDALGTLAVAAAGADLITGAGALGAGGAFSAQKLVMDTELFSWNAFIAQGICVDDETIAADAIAQVGIGGNYLGQRHTRRHMKDVWRPRLLDRSMWDAWVASGREGAYEKATARAGSLVEEHESAALDEDVARGLRRIAAEAGAVQS